MFLEFRRKLMIRIVRPDAAVFLLVAVVEIGIDLALEFFDGIESEGTAAEVLLVSHDLRLAKPKLMSISSHGSSASD